MVPSVFLTEFCAFPAPVLCAHPYALCAQCCSDDDEHSWFISVSYPNKTKNRALLEFILIFIVYIHVLRPYMTKLRRFSGWRSTTGK